MSDLFSYRDTDIYCHHTVDLSPDPERFTIHAHEQMEVLYFISGSGSYLVEGYHYSIQAGDIFIMRTTETHKMLIDPDVPYERIAIHFRPELFDFIDPERTLLRPFLDRHPGQQNRYGGDDTRCSALQEAFRNFTFEQTENIRLTLISRILQFLTSLQNIYNQDSPLPSYAKDLPSQLVAYVNEHLFEDISLQTVADAFYRSRSQISRIFRHSTGSSLWEYIVLKRLLAARAMLQRGESAMTACTACGFSDYSAFYRAYRTQFGHSPKKDAPH